MDVADVSLLINTSKYSIVMPCRFVQSSLSCIKGKDFPADTAFLHEIGIYPFHGIVFHSWVRHYSVHPACLCGRHPEKFLHEVNSMAAYLLAVPVPVISPEGHALMAFPSPLIARTFHLLMLFLQNIRNGNGVGTFFLFFCKINKPSQSFLLPQKPPVSASTKMNL